MLFISKATFTKGPKSNPIIIHKLPTSVFFELWKIKRVLCKLDGTWDYLEVWQALEVLFIKAELESVRYLHNRTKFGSCTLSPLAETVMDKRQKLNNKVIKMVKNSGQNRFCYNLLLLWNLISGPSRYSNSIPKFSVQALPKVICLGWHFQLKEQKELSTQITFKEPRLISFLMHL